MGWLTVVLGGVAAYLFYSSDKIALALAAAVLALLNLWSYGVMHNFAVEAAKQRATYRGGFSDFEDQDLAAVPGWPTNINIATAFLIVVLLIWSVVQQGAAMRFWLVSALLVLVTVTIIIIVKRKLSARRAIPEELVELSGVTNAVFATLALQSVLFGHRAGTAPRPEAGDDWSNGYIQGFTRYVIDQAGRFDEIAIAAAVANIFERLFGRSEGKRINALRDLTGDRELSARNGFLAGEVDARKFLESGGVRGNTGWIQHVRADLFSTAGAPR